MFRNIASYGLAFFMGSGMIMSYVSPAIGLSMLITSGVVYLLLDYKSKEWKQRVSRDTI